MIIARGLIMMIKIAFAVGCVVGAIMIFPIYYEVCDTVVTLLVDAIWMGEGMGALMTMFLSFFPYLSIFLIGLGMYIGLCRLLDSATGGSGREDLDGI